jgi:tetratricopeptide (TPR) repeat protein
MKFLDKFLKLEKNKDFWYSQAIHYFETGEYKQAEEALLKNMEVNKKSYEALFLFGKIHFKLNNFPESLEYYHKALEEYRKTNLRNSVKIDQMKNVQKFEEAVRYADLIHQTDEIDHEYWYHKGLTLFNLKKFDQASSCFEKCLETNHENPKILFALARCKQLEGNKQKSSEILDKVFTIDPEIKEKLMKDYDFVPLVKE